MTPERGTGRRRRLLLVHIDTVEVELAKGVAWNIRRYEGAFDEVVGVAIYGRRETIAVGSSRLESVGSDNRRIDLLLAPWRVFRSARRERPDALLTYDFALAWWTTLLARWLLRRPVVVVPVCLPEVLHQFTGRTVSGLPLPLERWSTARTFASATRIVSPASMPTYGDWIDGFRSARRHHVRVDPGIVEGFLGQAFYDALDEALADGMVHRVPGRMLYVGRLHDEKRAADLVEVLHLVRRRVPSAHLVIVGDGPLRTSMEARVSELGDAAALTVIPSLPNAELPRHYLSSSIFVSPYTGMSLREAAVTGTPVVAYDVAEIADLVRPGTDALLVPVGDCQAMADAVALLLENEEERARYARNIQDRSDAVLGRTSLEAVLSRTFDFLERRRR